MIAIIPPEPGTYSLILNLSTPRIIQIGKLGQFTFPAGDYVYVGSAMGPGGLQARLSRHLRGDGRQHWHIDWLRAVTDVLSYCFLMTESPLECRWGQALAGDPGASLPVPRFGASDCRSNGMHCAAHLILFKSGIQAEKLQEILSLSDPLTLNMVRYSRFTSDSQADCADLE
jgi:Uri superfamily endonuclease